MPLSRARGNQLPIIYRDRKDRVWSVSEVAVLKVVSPAIDGPNVELVIRFEHMGEERFARWMGGGDWREPTALQRLFESVDTPPDDTGVGPAPPETVALWVKLVVTMGPDELADFEARTFKQWHRASLSALRIAIDRRRRELER
ncbi:MAG TPA: hypothetical protein VL308_22360 [Gemmatimonadaceae bacterium]|nr:hypothetical protein [Gemmatimonadaceae bacterium]